MLARGFIWPWRLAFDTFIESTAVFDHADAIGGQLMESVLVESIYIILWSKGNFN